MDFKTGGQKVILRLVEAYGFSTRQMLCDHLGVSKSTLATRFMRDIFPAEWVIQCSLETGVSLNWLTSGTGTMYEHAKNDVIAVRTNKIINGKIKDSNCIMFDKCFIPDASGNLETVIDNNITYFTDDKLESITDGIWVLEIEGLVCIREIIRIPTRKVKIIGDSEFECSLDEVKFLRKVVGIYKNLK